MHIAVLMILGSSLLFNQIGLNFFHDAHDAHERYSRASQNQTLLLNHGEHCQVCSLEVLFSVLLPASVELPSQTATPDFTQRLSLEPVLVFHALSQGRAPPAAA